MRSLGKHHGKTNEPGPLRLDRPTVVELNGSMTATEAIKRLSKHPDVFLVERDHVGDGGLVPNDPSYSLQYHHQKIQSETAWGISTGSSSVVVAVLDTGLMPLSEFSNRILPGHNYVAGNERYQR